jgi:pimeloyl-ACP methyl ester carboxylesterase
MNALAEGLLTLTFGGAGAILLYGGSREMLDASREFIALTVDPIFFGLDVPQGDGHLVMVLPGLFAADGYLRPLCGWLDRIGYTSLASGWTRNNGRLAPLAAQTAERLAAAVRQYGGPATLIGHSFGGVVARKVAREHPDLVRQVITMGVRRSASTQIRSIVQFR